jgi:hypothetical protein
VSVTAWIAASTPSTATLDARYAGILPPARNSLRQIGFSLTSSRTEPIMPNHTAAHPKTNIGALPVAQLKPTGTASAVNSATATPWSRLNASAGRSRPISRT